jgi:hypothetical protein
MLSNAFNYLVNFTGRIVTLRRGANSYNFKMAKSNYNRNLETVSYTVTKGREYVTSLAALQEVGLTEIKIKDTVTINGDVLSIVEVNEMVDVGGAIMGFRVRTN